MHNLRARLSTSLGLLYLFATPIMATPKIPTCEAIRAVVAPIRHPIASVEDHTNQARPRRFPGEKDHPVLRSCVFTVPGVGGMFFVTFYGQMDRHHLDRVVSVLNEQDAKPQTFSQSAYGDFAYIAPISSDTNIMESLVGDVAVKLLIAVKPEDLKKMAAEIVKLM